MTFTRNPLKSLFKKNTVSLTLPIKIMFIKHSMHLAKHVIKTNLIPKSHSSLGTTTPSTQANNAAAELQANHASSNVQLPIADITKPTVQTTGEVTTEIRPNTTVIDAQKKMTSEIKTGKVIPLKEKLLGGDSSTATKEFDLNNSKFDGIKKMVIDHPNSKVTSINETPPEVNPIPTNSDFTSTASSGSVIGPLRASGNVPRTHLTPPSTQPVPNTQVRGMASVHGGYYTEPLPPIVPTLSPNLQEETQTETALHKTLGIVRCNNKDCLKVDCANSEGPCNIPPEKHQESFSQSDLDKNKLVLQSAGNTTSSDPTKLPDKQVIELDAQKNYSDQPKPQYAVIEQATVPLDTSKFKEEPKVTNYVQDPECSERILTTLEANIADENVD